MVVRPRHADELDAILDARRPPACRSPCAAPAPRSPATRSAPASSSTPSSTSAGCVSIDPEARTAVVQPGVVHANLQRAAAPHGLRFGPDPSTAHPLHDRRDDRQQRLRLAGARLRPDRRQRGGAGRRAGAPGADRRRGASSAPLVRPAPRARAHRVRPVRAGRSAATRSSTCCRSTAAASTGSWSARRAPSRVVRRGHRAAGRRRGRPAAGRARLPVDGRGGRRRPGAARRDRRPAWSPARGWTRGSSTWCGPRGARSRSCRAGAGWLFVEVVGAEAPGLVAKVVAAGGRARAPAGDATRPRRPRCGGSARTAPGWPPAACTTPAYSGWEDAAVPPERLGAWLRDFDELLKEHGLDGVPYGHFGDGCVHVRIDFPFQPGDDGSATVFRDFLTACALKLRDHRGSLSGEHGDGRARSELLPLMYDAESLAALRRGQGDLRPRATCSTPATWSTRRRWTPTCARSGRGSRCCRCSGCRTTVAAGRRGAPLHRRRQVRRAVDHGRDVPVVPRHPRREGLHPRPVPGAPGGARRLAGAGARGPRGRRGARPLPGLQGLRVGLPDRRGHGDVQGRGAAPEARRPGRTPPAQPPPARPAARGGRIGPRRSRRWPTG